MAQARYQYGTSPKKIDPDYERKGKKTKKNEKMCFINAMDEVSNIDLVLFPKVYEKNQNINRLDVIHLFGRVEKRFDKVQIIVNKMEILKGD